MLIEKLRVEKLKDSYQCRQRQPLSLKTFAADIFYSKLMMQKKHHAHALQAYDPPGVITAQWSEALAGLSTM
jgi:hypothetical protein